MERETSFLCRAATPSQDICRRVPPGSVQRPLVGQHDINIANSAIVRDRKLIAMVAMRKQKIFLRGQNLWRPLMTGLSSDSISQKRLDSQGEGEEDADPFFAVAWTAAAVICPLSFCATDPIVATCSLVVPGGH